MKPLLLNFLICLPVRQGKWQHRPGRDRRFLIAWIEQSAAEIPVELLPDDQVLVWCDMQMQPDQQEILDKLMVHNREGTLNETERRKLDELMKIYRCGLVRKARAWKVAVERGLKSPLN